MTAIPLLAGIGFFLSLYAVYVKRKASKSKNYKPICDISKNISCTKAFKSSYGRLLVLPNSVYGILFYLLIYILAISNNIDVIFYLSIFATIGSIYLAYISYIKQKNYCVVCTATYLVNILLLIFSYSGR